MVKMKSILKLVAGLALVTAFIGCASTQKRESTGQYVDDSVITTKVKAAVFNDPALKTMQINVKTYKGVVQLSGFVDSERTVTKAGEAARKVENVLAVQNDLVVK